MALMDHEPLKGDLVLKVFEVLTAAHISYSQDDGLNVMDIPAGLPERLAIAQMQYGFV